MVNLRAVIAGLLVVFCVMPSADAKDIWPPPPRYDSGPLLNPQFPSPIISHLAASDLDVACEGHHLACSYVDNGEPCRIFLPLVGWEPMLRHEMGHCRGWSADHSS